MTPSARSAAAISQKIITVTNDRAFFYVRLFGRACGPATSRGNTDPWPPSLGLAACMAIALLGSVAVGAANGTALPRPGRSASLLPPQRPNIGIRVELIRVSVVVLSEFEGFIGGLRADHFSINDDGRAHRAEQFIPDDEAATIGILLDSGAGMKPLATVVQKATMMLVDLLRPDDEIFLIEFADRARLKVPFSKDRTRFHEALEQYEPVGSRALNDAILLGLNTLRDATYDKRSLIVLTVGGDSSSVNAESAVELEAHRAGVIIQVIHLAENQRRWRPTLIGNTDDVASEEATLSYFVQALAHRTGGLTALRSGREHMFGGVSGWLESACQSITSYINNQYLLFYAPQNPPERGAWRRIAVHVGGGVNYKEVRARSGYVR